MSTVVVFPTSHMFFSRDDRTPRCASLRVRRRYMYRRNSKRVRLIASSDIRGASHAEICLPKKIQDAMWIFLHLFHSRGIRTLHCLGFACMVENLKIHDACEIPKYWQSAPWKLDNGTIVFLETPKKTTIEFHHAAIHLGRGLYLSVYGVGGYLEIATLPDMMKNFRARTARVVVPR